MTLIEFSWFIPVLIILVIWDIIWKLIALWKAARNGHTGWYIVLALVNSVGVLPIIYILTFRKKKQEE
jgi:hypothetical protein